MTQAPTPGPLTSESVKLLVKGDWLTDGFYDPWQFSHIENGTVYGLDGYTAMIEPLLVFNSFIGRPDESGWMPWSGGENPVPGQRVVLRLRSGITSGVLASEEAAWDRSSIIAFRLAPAAPVEASGSEREHGPKCWGKTSISDEMAHCYCGSTDSRPQPSGETREPEGWRDLLEMIAGERKVYLGHGDYKIEPAFSAEEAQMAARKAIMSHPLQHSGEKAEQYASGCGYSGHEFGASYPDSTCIDGYLWDLDSCEDSGGGLTRGGDIPCPKCNPEQTSARPLALGGQKGEEADAAESAKRLKTLCAGWSSAEAAERASAITTVRVSDILRVLDLSTTPARAEAQDEGAAGEREDIRRWQADQSEFFQSNVLEIVAEYAAWRDRQDAHPSPTPAADADRVREAIIQAVSKGLDNEWKDWEITNAILAALKSEGK